MGLLQFNYRSNVLGYYVNITVAYPTDDIVAASSQDSNFAFRRQVDVMQPGMKFQTVYLIHGGGDEDTLTYRYTNAERYAQKNRVMLVTPGIPNSFGADSGYGVSYMRFLTEELPQVIQSYFASSPKREDNFVMGYAMGGNVALAMAMMHPELYAACVDMSGGIGYTLSTENMVRELEGDHFRNHFYRFNATFGEPEDFPGSRHDLYPIVKKHIEEGRELTDLTIVCGDKEFIRTRVEEDVRILKELNYPVKYVLAEGYDHDFDCWDHFIRVSLDEWLPLKRKILFPAAKDGCGREG